MFADVTGIGIIRVTAFEVKAACMGIVISRELPYEQLNVS